MIDVHCHLLPNIDDGAKSEAEAVDMARLAVSDGISVVVCTPHILPGVYDNEGPGIRSAVDRLRQKLKGEGVPLTLDVGADIHMAPDLLERLRSGRAPSLAGSRYVLLEPPSGVVPPRFEHHLFDLVSAGYVPVITHPERLSWPRDGRDTFRRIVSMGGWLQITAGSLLGMFGSSVKRLSEELLLEGLVHIVASDAHSAGKRRPGLSAARDAAAKLIGEEDALHLVSTRPAGILDDVAPSELPAPRRVRSERRSPR